MNKDKIVKENQEKPISFEEFNNQYAEGNTDTQEKRMEAYSKYLEIFNQKKNLTDFGFIK